MIGDGRSRRVTALEERQGFRGAPRLRRARRTLGSVRGHLGVPHINGRAISGPLAPDRGAPRLGRGASERWGVSGPISGPLAPDRGAPRLGRGASERWGVWGAISGPPTFN